MKTSRNALLRVLIMMLVFGAMLIGCDEPTESDPGPTIPQEKTYTVWTDSGSYSEFKESFGELNDGYYFSYEFKSDEWDSISSSLTNEGKYNWTESEINKWFIGRGFGSAEANKETSWLMTINHGFLASRSGSIVHMLLK